MIKIDKSIASFQEMQRIESDKAPAVRTEIQTVAPPAAEAAQAEPKPETEPDAGKETAAEMPVQSRGQDVQPVDKAHVETTGGIPSTLAVDSVPLDVAADSDTAELEFASETEGEPGRRDEDDLLSGNESDRSQRAKWYGANGNLLRAESGVSTVGESGKGGWFDWELV